MNLYFKIKMERDVLDLNEGIHLLYEIETLKEKFNFIEDIYVDTEPKDE